MSHRQDEHTAWASVEELIAAAQDMAGRRSAGLWDDWHTLADSIETARYRLDPLLGVPVGEPDVLAVIALSIRPVSELLRQAAERVGEMDAPVEVRTLAFLLLTDLMHTARQLEAAS
ncbi:hypothetical protein PZ938_00065 [Luteipulveratus sp. YIM 133132]|uniref:hypothetical protein n=1 Tax=Luteipulveratus flavus TaxID=3031728 RepID=UPI0023B0608F|nr:hypothetical protein [Luteipulveratus sp. YIM 133132]MDE9363988.1 hypothetical protein [Luteipulveratus sp. YIM 133132]